MAAGSKLWSAYGLAVSVLAGLVARRAVTALWRVATGKKPPENPSHPDVSLSEAVALSVASGAAVGVAKMIATREGAAYYRKSTGHLPSDMEDTES